MRYTPEEEQTIRSNFKTLPCTIIGSWLGRSPESVRVKAQKLGLERTKEERKAINATYNAGQFSTGAIPHNAGKKYPGRAPKNAFQPGQKPVNTLEDGEITTRLSHTGRKEIWIKIAGAWQPLRRYNWETLNGPIPTGFLVIHKDNNPLNCDISNLELITKAQNCARNAKKRKKNSKKLIEKGDRIAKERGHASITAVVEKPRNKAAIKRELNQQLKQQEVMAKILAKQQRELAKQEKLNNRMEKEQLKQQQIQAKINAQETRELARIEKFRLEIEKKAQKEQQRLETIRLEAEKKALDKDAKQLARISAKVVEQETKQLARKEELAAKAQAIVIKKQAKSNKERNKIKSILTTPKSKEEIRKEVQQRTQGCIRIQIDAKTTVLARPEKVEQIKRKYNLI